MNFSFEPASAGRRRQRRLRKRWPTTRRPMGSSPTPTLRHRPSPPPGLARALQSTALRSAFLQGVHVNGSAWQSRVTAPPSSRRARRSSPRHEPRRDCGYPPAEQEERRDARRIQRCKGGGIGPGQAARSRPLRGLPGHGAPPRKGPPATPAQDGAGAPLRALAPHPSACDNRRPAMAQKEQAAADGRSKPPGAAALKRAQQRRQAVVEERVGVGFGRIAVSGIVTPEPAVNLV